MTEAPVREEGRLVHSQQASVWTKADFRVNEAESGTEVVFKKCLSHQHEIDSSSF